MERFVDESISRQALADFLKDMEQAGNQAHCLVLYQQGRLLLRYAVEPYRWDDKRELYSLSKTFTSTAFGLAFDRGLIRPEDKVLSLFPEYAPLCRGDEKWQRLELRHVMSMTDGHAACVFPQMAFGGDSVRAYFETPLSYEPGSTFVYNTGATCLMAEAVRRATGKPVPQLLAEEVFAPLGIGDFGWEACLDGHCDGGTGLSLSCDDVARLGLLYLNEGRWNGRQILSPEWTRMATSRQVDTPRNGSPDWTAGYGYQFWRNEKAGFRGDGAFGQACIVLPEKQLVLALLSESTNMSGEFESMWRFLDRLHTAEGNEQPRESCLPAGDLSGASLDTGWRPLAENPAGILSLRVQADESCARVSICDEHGVQTLTAPSGCWQENRLSLPNMRPSLHHMMPRRHRQALGISAAAHREGDALAVECRSRNCPHAYTWRFTLPEGRLQAELISPLDVFGDEKILTEK